MNTSRTIRTGMAAYMGIAAQVQAEREAQHSRFVANPAIASYVDNHGARITLYKRGIVAKVSYIQTKCL